MSATKAIFLMSLLSFAASGQPPGGFIEGRVDSGNRPVAGVQIAVEETGATTASDGGGNFRLGPLAPGAYTLVTSGGGFVPRRSPVTVQAAAVATVTISVATMSASVDVVESLKEYHLEETSLATRTSVRIIDLPQSVQVFPNQLIEDRAILEGNELFRNISGINQSPYSSMVFRGFTQREILYNGARGNPFGSLEGDVSNSGFSTSQIRLTNIQRVEVLKGPTAALYGAGEPGGLINYVTKQPKETFDAEMQFRLGSFDQKMVNTDLSGPAGKRLLWRGAFYFEDRDTFRNNTAATNSHAAGNLTYKASDRHRWGLEAEYVQQRLPGNRLRGVPVDAAGNFLADYRWTANEPSDYIKMIGRVLQLQGSHNFTSAWDLQYTVRYLEYENGENSHEPRGLNAATPAGRTMRREFRDFYRSNDDWSAVANLSRTFRTRGAGTHTLLFGGETIRQDHAFRSGRAREREVGGVVPPIDLFNPVYGLTTGSSYGVRSFTTSTARTNRNGFYAQDQIALNRIVQLLVSGRVDRYADRGFSGVPLRFDDTAFSGRAGISIRPVQQLSFYGNYATSFTRAPIFSQAAEANGPHKPETGRQFEAGVKSELLDRRLLLTGAYFHIQKENILRPDPANGPRGDNFNAVLSVGEARSRGFEFNLEGFLTRRWYAAFNYAFVATEILRDNTAALIGQPLANVPRHTTGLFTRYNFLRRTGIGFGLEQVTERVEPFGGIRAPGYAIGDIGIYQELSDRARLQFQVTNVTNRIYAASSLFAARAGNFPGQPRAFMLTLTVNPFRR
jgi:iron complex outermembrane recepter protein